MHLNSWSILISTFSSHVIDRLDEEGLTMIRKADSLANSWKSNKSVQFRTSIPGQKYRNYRHTIFSSSSIAWQSTILRTARQVDICDYSASVWQHLQDRGLSTLQFLK
jgi:hypothetical protein